MTKDNRNGLIFLAVIITAVVLMYQISPVLQADLKRAREKK